MVAEEDYAEAERIIQEWDEQQPRQELSEPISKEKSGFGYGVIGLLLGIGATAIYYNTPVTEDGIDYNGDGVLDERWTYLNYRISKAEVDRNLDGKIDLIQTFDHKGLIESSLIDYNFDGTFESEGSYHNGNAIWEKIDTTGDGFKDLHLGFKHGVFKTATFINASSRKPVKIQYYSALRLQEAEVDTTGDGVLDTKYIYDQIEEVAEKIIK
jgi:antitoxin component YwqK of YwqJK toxin-antitoxin module